MDEGPNGRHEVGSRPCISWSSRTTRASSVSCGGCSRRTVTSSRRRRTGLDGLDIAEATTGIELVILDVGLPDISGLEVARRIRATGSEVAILMLTARDTVGDRVTGLDAGADDYLVKPFAYEELAARIRALGAARRESPGARNPSSWSGRSSSTRRHAA